MGKRILSWHVSNKKYKFWTLAPSLESIKRMDYLILTYSGVCLWGGRLMVTIQPFEILRYLCMGLNDIKVEHDVSKTEIVTSTSSQLVLCLFLFLVDQLRRLRIRNFLTTPIFRLTVTLRTSQGRDWKSFHSSRSRPVQFRFLQNWQIRNPRHLYLLTIHGWVGGESIYPSISTGPGRLKK